MSIRSSLELIIIVLSKMSFGFDRRDWKYIDNESESNDNNNNQEETSRERKIRKTFFSQHVGSRQECLKLYDDLRQYSNEALVPELMEALTPEKFLEFLGLSDTRFDNIPIDDE